MVVLTSVGTKEDAQRIARDIVERRLAACVQIQPVDSVYTWKGAIHEEPEHLLVIKTRRSRLDTLQHHLRSIHPYELPEFAAFETTSVSNEYENWIVSVTGLQAGSGNK